MDLLSGSVLATRHPWLRNASAWSFTWTGGDWSPHTAGVWPIGNGFVFAHAGLSLPLNRLRGITGPTYQTDGDHRVEGAFGDCWLEVAVAGRTIPWKRQSIWRPRRSGVVVTEAEGEGVVLRTVDCAPPNCPAILRVVELQASPGTQLLIRFPNGEPAGPNALLAAHGPNRHALLDVLDAPVRTAKGTLIVSLDDQPSSVVSIRIGSGPSVDAARHATRSLPVADELFERTRAFWSRWIGTCAIPEPRSEATDGPTGDAARMRDLLEDGVLGIRMQQAANGGVAPMVHFKGTWARDNNGPVRLFLALGAVDEVRALLRYYHDAAITLGEIPNHAPLDLVPHSGSAPGALRVPSAEVPSWIVLQHAWWLAAGGEGDLIREHWPLLERCVIGQQLSADGLLPFHGDETYLHGALYSVFPDRCGWPNGLPGHAPDGRYAPFSLESTAAFVVASEALAAMSERLGLRTARDHRAAARAARKAIERLLWNDTGRCYAPARYPLTGTLHPVPVAPINLAPHWFGYHAPTELRARTDLETVMERVGWRGSTPDCAYEVGMTCGYLLHALTAHRSPLAPRALAEVVRRASPAGEWAEVYGPGGTLTGGYDLEHPNRLRPWEGGINLAAIVRYYGEADATVEATGAAGASDAVRADDAVRPVLVVSADAGEIDASRSTHEGPVTIVEPASIVDAARFAKMLFGSDGSRHVDVLVLTPSATAGDRRSMIPAKAWENAGLSVAISQFVAAGGRVERGEGSTAQVAGDGSRRPRQ
jgi:hypothetical protein